MKSLCWSLFFVVHMLPQFWCLEESVHSSEGKEKDQSLEPIVTAMTQLRQLAETLDQRLKLVETMEKRLELVEQLERRVNEQNKIIQQLKFSLEVHSRKLQEPKVPDFVMDKTNIGQQESRNLRKRSDDTASWEPVVAQVTQRLNLAEADIQVLKNSVVAEEHARGTVYVRWGQNACPSTAELVYSGYVGGSWYAHSGAATNYLCLPPDPAFTNHTLPRYGHSFVYGAEYETCDEPECNLNPTCAVCRISRESSVMLPARDTCYPGWTLEYSGYLMTDLYSYAAGMEYICVDSSHGYVPGNKADDNGALLHYTVYQCGSLPCPPYIADKIVVCAVCSK